MHCSVRMRKRATPASKRRLFEGVIKARHTSLGVYARSEHARYPDCLVPGRDVAETAGLGHSAAYIRKLPACPQSRPPPLTALGLLLPDAAAAVG